MYYLRAWSTTLPCLIVGGGIIYEWGGIFPSIFKMGRSKYNDVVKIWKLNVKIEGF